MMRQPVLAEPLRGVEWGTITLPNLQQVAKAFGVNAHLAVRDARGKTISVGEKKKAISALLSGRVKDLALEQQRAGLDRDAAGSVSCSCTAELCAAAEALREWGARGQPVLDRVQQALAGAQSVLREGSGAADAQSALPLVADIQDLVASARAARAAASPSELRLASACDQLSPALALAASSCRSALNSENSLVSVLELDDIRMTLLSPHLLDLRSLCRLRVVSTQFSSWVRQSLGLFPRLQQVEITQPSSYYYQPAKDVFGRKEHTLDLSSMTISLSDFRRLDDRLDACFLDGYSVERSSDFQTICPATGSSSSQVISQLTIEYPDRDKIGLLISDSSANVVALWPENPQKYTRVSHAFELPDSRLVLFAMRFTNIGNVGESVAIVSPGTASLSEVQARMSAKRNNSAAGVLSDGRILFTGGLTMPSDTRELVNGRSRLIPPTHEQFAAALSTEAFDPATLSWSALACRNLRSNVNTGVTLSDGRFLACSTDELANAEIYDPKQNCWSVVEGFDVLTDEIKYLLRRIMTHVA